MRTWGAGVVLGFCLVLASLAGASSAGAVDDGAAARGPVLGWQGYDGARLGMSLRQVARRLDTRVRQPDGCEYFRSVVTGRGSRWLSFTDQFGRKGRANVISAGSGVRGPAGVRDDMRLSEARRRLERAGHDVRFRKVWNDAYDFWMRYAFASHRGRVLLLRHDDGRVFWLRTLVSMPVARRAMKDVGGC